MPEHNVDVLIMAAGRGTRMGAPTPKPYRLLSGVSVLRWALMAFLKHDRVRRVQVVVHPDDLPLYGQAVDGLMLPPAVFGGQTRQESVRLGLEALAHDRPDAVLIHDAARPFVEGALIDRVLEGLRAHAAVIPGLAVTDTVKHAPKGIIKATVPREDLWLAQTPQGFQFDAIVSAHQLFKNNAFTDDAQIAEQAGLDVLVVPGDVGNIKITREEDLMMSEQRLFTQKADVRVAFGYDVHRFVPGDHVWLCGVRIEHSATLLGHSDADAGLHALTDALLGTIGAGDIGVHFPPTDARWKGAPSAVFLQHALSLIRAQGGVISHVDVTLICEAPKVGPHRPAMIASLATLLEIDPSRVSVKATTTEKLGFAGRGEGLAAQAVATVRLPL